MPIRSQWPLIFRPTATRSRSGFDLPEQGVQRPSRRSEGRSGQGAQELFKHAQVRAAHQARETLAGRLLLSRFPLSRTAVVGPDSLAPFWGRGVFFSVVVGSPGTSRTHSRGMLQEDFSETTAWDLYWVGSLHLDRNSSFPDSGSMRYRD